jgi:hypothetical protein
MRVRKNVVFVPQPKWFFGLFRVKSHFSRGMKSTFLQGLLHAAPCKLLLNVYAGVYTDRRI